MCINTLLRGEGNGIIHVYDVGYSIKKAFLSSDNLNIQTAAKLFEHLR